MEKRRYEYSLKKFQQECLEDLSKTEEGSSESEEVVVSLGEEFQSVLQLEDNVDIFSPPNTSSNLNTFAQQTTFPIGRPPNTPMTPRKRGTKKSKKQTTFSLILHSKKETASKIIPNKSTNRY